MATVFNDTIFAQSAFQQLTSLLTPLNAFSTDISSEVTGQGSAVVVPLYGNATTTTFSQSTTVMEQTGGTISAVTVTLDKRKITPLDITHQQLAESSNAGRWDRWAVQLGKSAAKAVLADVWSLVLTTNFGEAILTTASANYTSKQLVDAQVALIKAGVTGDKSFIGNMSVYAALLKDTNITLALNRGDQEAIKNGNLGYLYGLNIYGSDVLPTNSISLIGFACGADGIAFAMRNLGDYIPVGDYEAVETMVDQESGISALYTRHWSRAQGKYFVNLHTLYGYSVAVTGAIKLLTTPTT